MMDSTDSPYALLGIDQCATSEQVRRAYRREMMRHHPDRNQNSPASHEHALHLTQAYETLKKRPLEAPPRRKRSIFNTFSTPSYRTVRATWGTLSFG